MVSVTVELHARHHTDLPTLQLLRRELDSAGISVALSASSELRVETDPELLSGTQPCRLRVLVAGPGAVPLENVDQVVTIHDRLTLPQPSEDFAHSQLVLVPGALHVRELDGRTSAEVISCGSPRLDGIRLNPQREKSRARSSLCVASDARLVLFVPRAFDADVELLAAAGLQVLISVEACPAHATARYRELAARVPGLALADGDDSLSALAACDVVVANGGSLFHEAIVVGTPVVRVEGTADSAADDSSSLGGCLCEVGPRVGNLSELEAVVRSMLSDPLGSVRFADARSACCEKLIDGEGSAVARVAQLILERVEVCRRNEMGSDDQTSVSSEEELLKNVEARVAFGDTEAALSQLEAYVAQRPSVNALRVLAATHRRNTNLTAARGVVRRAEELAKSELARVLCESGRIELEADQLDAASAAFSEAHRIAPELAEASIGLGSLTLHSGDARAAEAHFRTALQHQKSAKAWSGLGLALGVLGRSREALATFEAALDLETDCQAAIYGLVQTAFQTGEIAVAERRVRAFTELHAGNLDLLFTLAGLRHQLGDRSGAIEVLDRIALFEPEYSGLSELRQKLGG